MTPQEINKYLAEKIGWKFICTGRFYISGRPIDAWEMPNGEAVPIRKADFSHDIGACFKWLVPYLQQHIKNLSIHFNYSNDGKEVDGYIYGYDIQHGGEGKTDAQAFSAAMVEYFKEKKE